MYLFIYLLGDKEKAHYSLIFLLCIIVYNDLSFYSFSENSSLITGNLINWTLAMNDKLHEKNTLFEDNVCSVQ